MPRGYTQLVIYLKDEEERKKIKEFCEKMNIPVSVFVREFFRSLFEGGSSNIIVNSGNKIEIGEIKINLTQHNNVQINNNIIAFVFSKLSEFEEMTKKALSSRSSLTMRNTLAYLNQAFKRMREDIKNIVK